VSLKNVTIEFYGKLWADLLIGQCIHVWKGIINHRHACMREL